MLQCAGRQGRRNARRETTAPAVHVTGFLAVPFSGKRRNHNFEQAEGRRQKFGKQKQQQEQT